MSAKDPMPEVGTAEELAPGLRRVLAPNPGPMTYWGTNTYLVGTDEIVVVDPGPDDVGHRTALLAAVSGARVRGVLVTHAHRDHSAGASALARAVGAPVLAFGTPAAGRSAVMVRHLARGGAGGGEGVDGAFRPDAPLGDGAVLRVGGTAIAALHTPGHFGGHLCFAVEDTILTGDVVMGWATTLISPPDGDVRDFLASAARLRARGAARLLPGHGPPVADPAARLDWLIAHRRAREAEIRAALAAGHDTAEAIARAVYRDLDPALLPAAARNVLAHLLDLEDRGLAATDADRPGAIWRPTGAENGD